jgi:hypothetical protein
MRGSLQAFLHRIMHNPIKTSLPLALGRLHGMQFARHLA